MRTIKFRGKRTDGQGWVYGWLFGADAILSLDSTYTITSLGTIVHGIVGVLPESVGQWTGIEDVYEGDIAKIFSYFYECGMQSRGYLESECKYEVVTFRDGAFYVGKTLLSNADYEIIGNIHDKIYIQGFGMWNPELMEVE